MNENCEIHQTFQIELNFKKHLWVPAAMSRVQARSKVVEAKRKRDKKECELGTSWYVLFIVQ